MKTKIHELTATHGGRLIREILLAAKHHATEDAFTYPVSGNVDIDDREVLGLVKSDPNVLEAIESVFYKAWPSVRDEVVYSKRVKWQENRKLEKEIEMICETEAWI